MIPDSVLRAILANPDDDGPRRAAIPHLGGDPRAELIDVQCRLAAGIADPAARATLEARERSILAENAPRWDAALGAQRVRYRRGFAVSAAVRLSDVALDVLDRAPITSLALEGDGGERAAAVALNADPRLARLASLWVFGDWEDGAVGALLGSRHLAGLGDLGFDDDASTVRAASAVAGAHLPALAGLTFAGDYAASAFGDDGVRALVAGHLPSLRRLHLLNLGCGPATGACLAGWTSLSGLAVLDLGWGSYTKNAIGPAGAAALAGSVHLGSLERLVLDFNELGDEGVAALAGSRALRSLRELSIKDVGLTDAGMVALAAGDGLPRLAVLEATFNRGLTAEGVVALAGSARMSGLEALWLRQIPLGSRAAAALAAASAPALADLNLLECGVSDDGALAIAASTTLTALAKLQLSGNRLAPATVDALRARFGDGVSARS